MIAELKATLCNFFTLKQQLQKQVNGRVSYNSMNGVSVTVTPTPLICCCTMSLQGEDRIPALHLCLPQDTSFQDIILLWCNVLCLWVAPTLREKLYWDLYLQQRCCTLWNCSCFLFLFEKKSFNKKEKDSQPVLTKEAPKQTHRFTRKLLVI